MSIYWAQYVLVGAIAMAVTFLLAPACRVLAVRLNVIAHVRDRDVHSEPTPYLGGLAMCGGAWAGFVCATAVPRSSSALMPSLVDAQTILVGASLLFFVGLLDDLLDMPAVIKLVGQIMAGLIAINGGIQIFVVPLPGGEQLSLGSPISEIVSLLVFLAVVNAVNMIDGLDGLAAGVVAAGATALFLLATADPQSGPSPFNAALVSAVLVGICLGFYYHNAPPAKMFMGDAGSLFLGALLASGVLLSMQSLPTPDTPAGSATLGMGSRIAVFFWAALPVAIVGIPLLDLGLAMGRRLWNGTGLFVADKRHLHHVLVASGRSPSVASLLLTAWSMVVAVGAAWIVIAPSTAKVVVVGIACVMIIATHVWHDLRGPT